MFNRLIPGMLRLFLALEGIAIILAGMQSDSDLTVFFQHAARLTGRVSLFAFSVLLVYVTLNPRFERDTDTFRHKSVLFRDFAIVHVIHGFFLAVAVYLAPFELIPLRVAGGAIAYIFIVGMPFLLQRLTVQEPLLVAAQGIYLLWVWLVFVMTYRARLAGETPTSTGTPAEWLPLYTFVLGLMIWRLGYTFWYRLKQR